MNGEEPGQRELRLTLDRREGGVCVLIDELGVAWEVPEWFAPRHVRDGDVLLVRTRTTTSGARHEVSVHRGATDAARGAVAEVLARVRASDPDRNR